jgi:hypothetical protein
MSAANPLLTCQTRSLAVVTQASDEPSSEEEDANEEEEEGGSKSAQPAQLAADEWAAQDSTLNGSKERSTVLGCSSNEMQWQRWAARTAKLHILRSSAWITSQIDTTKKCILDDRLVWSLSLFVRLSHDTGRARTSLSLSLSLLSNKHTLDFVISFMLVGSITTATHKMLLNSRWMDFFFASSHQPSTPFLKTYQSIC